MSVQSSNLTHNQLVLQDQLLCPVFLEPLFEAVSLVPCAHKVQQAAAEKIFGTTHGGWLVQSDKPCPVCRISVIGYMVDHSMRNTVKQLFELSENDLNAMLATVKGKLAEKCKAVKKDALVAMPYPGKRARFVHQVGNWDLFYLPGNLCRKMEFISSTKDSLIEDFSLLGYKNGKVAIQVKFSEGNNIVEYLKQFDIIVDRIDLIGYMTKNQDQLKVIFNIIAQNNEIPASHFEKIRDIVAKGTC